MGNYRFRLSDMIPNAWFYKLRDIGRSRKKYSSHPLKRNAASVTSQPKYSSYFTTQPNKPETLCNSPGNRKALNTRFPDPPRKSSKRRSKRKTIYKPSPKLASPSINTPDSFSCNEKLINSAWTRTSIPAYSSDYSSSPIESSPEPEFHESLLSESEEDDGFLVPQSFDHQVASWSSSCGCKVSSSTTDIIIDMDEESFERKTKKFDGFEGMSEVELPPILTKPGKFNDRNTEVTKVKTTSSKLEEIKAHRSLSVKVVKEERHRTRREQKTNPSPRKSLSNSMGIRLRSNSPKIASRKLHPSGRKSVSSSRNGPVSESFVVVKSSVDPQRDFRDSMVEMIVENNIRASKDLEELLACYLSLNSNEHHDLIVKAFEQIWFDMTCLRL